MDYKCHFEYGTVTNERNLVGFKTAHGKFTGYLVRKYFDD